MQDSTLEKAAVRLLTITKFYNERSDTMREYATQMEAARKGIVTKELEIVAKKENMTTEDLIKKGLVLLAN